MIEEDTPSLIRKGQFRAIVSANTPLCREHYRLSLHLPAFPPTEPGQFVQIACRDLDHRFDDSAPEVETISANWRASDPDLIAPAAVLRRPFSLAGRRDDADGVTLEFIHRVVGLGTHWLEQLKVGDAVHILGPLGNRFQLPRQHELAILVGGGVGIPPMLYLATLLANHSAVALCGVTTRDLLPLTIVGDASAHEPTPCIEEFARHKIPTLISTDDGSLGARGFVTAALEKHLDSLPANTQAVIFTCGPEPMMKAVAAIAIKRGIPCQVAVERAMACGMGTCQSCVIRVKTPMRNAREWAYRLACTDGPVFAGADLLW